MKHLFIVNPTAGGSDRTETIAAWAGRYFSGREDEFEVYTTAAPMDACSKVKSEAASGGELRVYSCGGDGTLNECVCGAAGNPNVAVACYPIGTGNDFIKMFGDEAARFSSLEELIEGETRPIDYMDCNGRPCLNICSVGIDARIGTSVHKYSRIPLIGGATGYITSLVVNFAKGITDELSVSCAGQRFSGKMNLVCVCNGSFYGGGFHPVPEARPDDGLLDLLAVKGVSRLGFLRLVGVYARGGYRECPAYITHLRADSLELESPNTLVVNLDGEAMYAKRLSIRLVPGGVNIIFPAGLGFFENEAKQTEALT